MAGGVVFSSPALFSATWFPARQRATATAFAAVANYIGVASAFILGISYCMSFRCYFSAADKVGFGGYTMGNQVTFCTYIGTE